MKDYYMHKRFENYMWIAVYLLIFLSGCALDPNPKMINIDSHSLSMFSRGSGTPTIVIDVGFGESYNSWMQIIDSLSAYTRVIAYDRAAYGQSEPGPFPRDCQQEVIELNSMLERAGVETPYILVGHSLGAMNAQYFAYRFPGVVAGLVLLDPPPLNWISGKTDFTDLDTLANQQTQSLLSMAEQARSSPDPEDEARAIYYETLASEHDEMFKASAEQMAVVGSFADLPITVIASGKPNLKFGASAERFQRFWINESKAVAMRSTRGRFILLEESTHNIYRDFPLQVISETRQILTSVKNN
jgi:pimeloyl-ACP methyl ester carboxylesterase